MRYTIWDYDDFTGPRIAIIDTEWDAVITFNTVVDSVSMVDGMITDGSGTRPEAQHADTS